ncbi:uncharacterized protein LOC129892856 [Solanum dulcamara]|uniref:uncharacterized protein LOC129892856 n=1 Tax=Solanum dulcamara TaxID=45834 RepID=UPI0024863FD7|nr:uncharacterized protein LOC129892856 [Solanum dulcamara]
MGDWMKLVLGYTINHKCPIKPADPTEEEIQPYNKWVKADEMARYYIFSSMANFLQHQHQSMTSAYDMLASLKEMFDEQNHASNQTAMKVLLTTKMAEGSSVIEHMLKLMNYLNEMEILGAEIYKESQAVETIIKHQTPAAFLVDKAGPLSSKPTQYQKKKKKAHKAVSPQRC